MFFLVPGQHLGSKTKKNIIFSAFFRIIQFPCTSPSPFLRGYRRRGFPTLCCVGCIGYRAAGWCLPFRIFLAAWIALLR